IAIDGVDEADLASEGVEGAETAAAEAAGAVGDLVADGAGGEHGTLAVGDIGSVEAALQAPLAVGQLLAYLGFHSKSLGGGRGGMAWTTMKPRKSRGISSFSGFQRAWTRDPRLLKD